jgi:hypothetical protein
VWVQIASSVVWLLFVATSIVSGVTLWVEEHPWRLYGFGVIVLLAPTFCGIYLYKHQQFQWLLYTSIFGIAVQLLIIRELAKSDS